MQSDIISISYVDLIGRFPKWSLRGNGYIFIGYHYNVNYILGLLIKNRRGIIIAKVWEKLYTTYKKAGTPLEMYNLDNKLSKDLVDSFNQEYI